MSLLLRIIVFYARFSSDMQRADSIENQLRNCRSYLDRLGVPHQDASVYKDEALSGAGVMGPELKKLVERIKRGEVHTLVVDDLSRITRRSDLPMLWEMCMAHKCRIISVIDNLDSDRNHDGMQAWFTGMSNHLSNKAHGARCRRSLVGRVLVPTGADGSHPYGYSTRFEDPEAAGKYLGEGPKPKKEVYINDDESSVVQEIYRRYADGESTTDIARDLNDRGVPTGRRSKRIVEGRRVSRGWHHSRINKLLKQQKYIGIWKWGEFEHIKDEMGRRLVHKADPDKVIRVEAPMLVIIERPLWDRVQTRLKRYSEKHHGRKKRKTPTRHAVEDYPTTPLSALLYCGTCDARMNACNTNNGQKAQRCPIAYRSKKDRKKKAEIGDVRACTMHGLVPVDRAEKALFDFLLERLNAAPEWIGNVYEHAKAAYRAEASAMPDELAALKAKLAAVNEAVKNLTQAVASGQVQGAALAALSASVNEREAEKVALATRVATLEANAAKAEAFPTLAEVRKQMANLPDFLRERSRETALLLRRFCGRVEAHQILQPGKKRGYMELRFHFNPMAAVELAFPDDERADLENSAAALPPVTGELVVLPLGEPTRLDRLMPEIIRLREVEGLSWKRIAKQLKVHEAWAAEYYRRRKEASS